jgi:methylase of polypeptide subunit release factors
LAPGGFALFEIGPSQLNWCRETSKKHKDFDNVRLYKDMAGKERFFYLRKT